MNNPQVAKYIGRLKDKSYGENHHHRRFAVDDLGKIGAPAVPALIEALKDEDGSVRRLAATALGKICAPAAPAVPALIEVLRDQFEGPRRDAAEALGKIGARADSAVPALIEALKDEDANVRLNAAESLGKFGARARSAVPALIEVLRDQFAGPQRAAAEALEKIGILAVPALVEAMKDKSYYVRKYASEALVKIGNSDTLQLMVLAESRFRAQERIELLERLRRVNYKHGSKTLRYAFPDTRMLCETVLNESNHSAETHVGAQTVLNWLNGDNTLLQAAQRDEPKEREELLHPYYGGTPEAQPDTLLRGSSAPDKDAEAPRQSRSGWKRLFKRG